MKSLLSFGVVVMLAASAFAQEAPVVEVVDATNLDGLRAKAGMEAAVEGMVTEVGTNKTGGITFINVGAPKKQGFVSVIFQDNYGAFAEGFDKYKAQKVKITGVIELYKGEQPQIKLTSPEQITIITEESPAATP